MLELLDKFDDIAIRATCPAFVALAARIDVERRLVIVMKRADAFEGGADGAQIDVAADDIDDVIGFLDALGQGYPIFRQRAPLGRIHPMELNQSMTQAHEGRPVAIASSIGMRSE